MALVLMPKFLVTQDLGLALVCLALALYVVASLFASLVTGGSRLPNGGAGQPTPPFPSFTLPFSFPSPSLNLPLPPLINRPLKYS